MRKYRFFGGCLASQASWLNKMSDKGLRLIRTEKLLYEFEKCEAGQYRYQVEFIGQKSWESAEDYVGFLEDFGYRVFFKNANLNYSVGKLQYRPWAEKGGRLAASSTTFGRELLIVEKENDGKGFELHTTYEDKLTYCKNLRRPWLFLFLVCAVLAIAARSPVWGILAAAALIAIAFYQAELHRLKKFAETKEW